MAVSKLDVIEQYMDNNGDLLALGKIHTYTGQLGGSTTPLATYSDNNGTANANPVVLDSSGRCQIWFTQGVAYNVVITDADDVVLQTIEMLEIPADATSTTSGFGDFEFEYPGGPPAAATAATTAGWLGGRSITRAITLPINLVGSFGFCLTNPAATFLATIRKNATLNDNGTQVGTISISTSGVFTFTTTGSAAISLAAGDELHVFGPVVADTTIADFGFTLVGDLA